MTPMHQPTNEEVIKTHHSLVIDGTDVEVTRIVEFIGYEWQYTWMTLLNISEMKFDIGHDTLSWLTESTKMSLLKYMTKISEMFPYVFIMYEYYTEREEEMEHAVFYLIGGQVTIDKSRIDLDHGV